MAKGRRRRITGRLRVAAVAAGAVSVALSAAPAAVGQQAAARQPAAAQPGDARARVTGRPILGSDGAGLPAAQAAPAGLPSRAQQIKVLTAVLQRMHDTYAKYASYTPGPQDVFDYGVGSLWRRGIDGAGTTVAVIEGWNDPGIAASVAAFDKTWGLPNPQITTIYPAGPLPATCPPGMVALGSYGSCSAWQGELTLDVISAHLMAPYARILISATPADTEIQADAAQQVAPPEMMKALEVISQRHLADSISISDGTGEVTYPQGRAEILAQNPGELAAAAAGVPVLNATGDCGVVQNLAVANGQCEDVSATPDTATWDDSPWVTAVGGSVPNVSPTDGARLGPDPVWHDPAPYAQFSEGAGFSSVFARPAYQADVASVTHSAMRSVPDITMDAQDGTSEATPLLNGILALATQLNGGHVLGPINPALYRILGPAGARAGISDVVRGNDSAETPTGQVTVPGFVATRGFDVASGWGTIFAPRFVPALVLATSRLHEESSSRHQAAAQLAGDERAVQLTSYDIPAPGDTSYLLASGFLPGYPVQMCIDGRTVATLTANSLGDVTYQIEPDRLGLAAGTHRLVLSSLLVTEHTAFRSR